MNATARTDAAVTLKSLEDIPAIEILFVPFGVVRRSNTGEIDFSKRVSIQRFHLHYT